MPWLPDKYSGIEPERGERALMRAGKVGEKFVPFSLKSSNVFFALPMSKGMSGGRFIEEYSKAVVAKDDDLRTELVAAAKANGITGKRLKKLISTAKSVAKKRRKDE